MTDQPPAEVAKHYYLLVAGTVMILTEEDTHSEAVQAIPASAVIKTNRDEIGLIEIAQANQAMQQVLAKKLEDTTYRVVDVVLIGVTRLGQMTEEDFNRRPPGLEIQEAHEAPVPQEAPPLFEDNVIDLTSRL